MLLLLKLGRPRGQINISDRCSIISLSITSALTCASCSDEKGVTSGNQWNPQLRRRGWKIQLDWGKRTGESESRAAPLAPCQRLELVSSLSCWKRDRGGAHRASSSLLRWIRASSEEAEMFYLQVVILRSRSSVTLGGGGGVVLCWIVSLDCSLKCLRHHLCETSKHSDSTKTCSEENFGLEWDLLHDLIKVTQLLFNRLEFEASVCPFFFSACLVNSSVMDSDGKFGSFQQAGS